MADPNTFANIRAKYPQYDDMSDSDFAEKFHQKFYSDMSFDDFANKVGYMGLGRQLLGNAELAGSAIASIPHGIAHAAGDIVNRISGDYSGNTPWVDKHIPGVEPGAAGKQLSDLLGQSLTQTIDKTGAGDAVTKGVGAVNEAGREPGTVGNFVREVGAPLAGDVATLAGARAPLMNAGRSVVSGVRNAVAAGKEAAGVGTDWHNAGYRNGGAHPIARQVAGDTGQEALTNQNQDVGNVIGSAESGHAPNSGPMSYETLADARAEPNQVWNRTANALPTQALPAETQAAIQAAAKLEKVSTLSQADQARVGQMAQNMTQGEQTGQQVIENMRTLRQEGFKRAASEDVDQQNIGKAQLDMARALESYVGKALPANADVSLEQFQAARKALAKNWTVQEALRGSDIDQQAVARMQRADPELLDGGLKTMADFANGPGRSVTSLPDRYNPPGLFRDVKEMVRSPVGAGAAGAAIATGHTVPAVAAAAAGIASRPLARAFLTGRQGAAVDAARAMFPGRPPETLAPLPSSPLPSGRLVRPGETGDVGAQGTGQGANPSPAAPARLGDFAKVLSEGLEQRPSPGLTAGPMGAPQGEGLPFTASPDVVGARPVQGGAPPLKPRFQDDYGNEVNPNAPEPNPRVRLGDRFAQQASPSTKPVNQQPRPASSGGLGDELAALQDYAKVVSQGVPEDIATRTTNNASGESKASVEAINRVRREQAAGQDRFLVDPDGKMWPVKGVDSVDFKPQKGSIFVQKGVGAEPYTILDRGGLPQAHAKGLLNRALAGGEGRLGSEF